MDYQNMDFLALCDLQASEEADDRDDGGGSNDQVFQIHRVCSFGRLRFEEWSGEGMRRNVCSGQINSGANSMIVKLYSWRGA